MLTKWEWLLTQVVRSLWLRATLMGLVGVLVALLALPVQYLIAEPLPFTIGSAAVDRILDILATSMLTVTIFSLSVMVSAYSAASSNVTPRATSLVKEDSTTQTVLATFLGAFLFSLVGIIALSTGAYTDVGRFILFVATLWVIATVLITLLRWIEHLSGLGRVGRTTAQLEDKVCTALRERIEYPCLGGRALESLAVPEEAVVVMASGAGYVQHVDMQALNCCAEEAQLDMGVLAVPGTLVHPRRALVWYRGRDISVNDGDSANASEDLDQHLRAAFTLGMERSFDQDPRFGLAVLSEVASRALSPAVNDPGTAIDVLNRSLRLFLLFVGRVPEVDDGSVLYPRLRVRPLSMDDLFEDLFLPIARDGAGMVEVQLRLQKVLLALVQNHPLLFGEEARRCSARALELARARQVLEGDLRRLQRVAEQIEACCQQARQQPG